MKSDSHTPLAKRLKLFVVDLDGTLLGGGHVPYVRIPDKVSAWLDELAEAGCKWAINTTWDPDGQYQLVLASPLKSRPTYFMGELGFRVARCTPAGPEPVKEYCAAQQERIDEWKREHFFPFIRKFLARFIPMRFLFYGHLMEMTLRQEDSADFLKLARDEANPEFLQVGGGGPGFSVMPPFLNKGLGLAEVVRLEGLEPDQVGAAGDSPADMAMMTPNLSRYYVAPGNAHEDVKKHVLANGGAVSEKLCGEGTVEAFRELDSRLRIT